MQYSQIPTTGILAPRLTILRLRFGMVILFPVDRSTYWAELFAVVRSRMPRQRSFPTRLQLRYPWWISTCIPTGVLCSWVIGANMHCKRFVALQLEVAHHFIERCAGGPTGGFEPPATFGATKTPKTLLVNPYQLPAHGRLCRCAPTLSDRSLGVAENG